MMDLLPASSRKRKKLLLAFVLLLVLTGAYFKLQQINQNLSDYIPPNMPRYQTQPLTLTKDQQPPCLQQTGSQGWQIDQNKLVVYPRCLTVLNSGFGSRFNFDLFFGQQKTKSSTLGTMQDNEVNMSLRLTDDNNNTTSLWPLQYQNSTVTPQVKLGLTFMQTTFANNENGVELKIVAPFAPSQSPDNMQAKISHAPFFYILLTAYNHTNHPQTNTILFTLGNYLDSTENDGVKTVYFSDSSAATAKLALSTNNPNANINVSKKSGGFDWQTTIPPHSSQQLQLIYSGYNPDPIILQSNEGKFNSLSYAYTNWFNNIDKVINFAYANRDEALNQTEQFEKDFDNSHLSAQEKWLAAQAFHSYLANTWLMTNSQNPQQYYYYVWEGEFKYLNTLDVAHDYDVLAGLYFPWAIKLELDSWQQAAKTDKIGTVIPHDLGIRFNVNNVQAYKIPGWETSGMPVEENANFILLAYWYWQQSQDDKYIQELAPFFTKLIDALQDRDTNQNGIADTALGMTTYDSDANLALKQAPDSTYLGLKQLAAYLAAEKMYLATGEEKSAQKVNQQAKLIANSIKQGYKDYGFIPLSLDKDFVEKNQFDQKTVYGNQEQGMAYISGLFYPMLTNLNSPILDELKPVLGKAFPQAYQHSIVTAKDGQPPGLQLTQYNELNLGWFSHSMMTDYIVQTMLDQKYDSWQMFFDRIYDNPYGFVDGHYFREPFYPPQTALLFYPRGVTIFAFLK